MADADPQDVAEAAEGTAHVWTVSATQVDAFLKCPRKWALGWLQRVPKTESEALAFGNALHASASAYRAARGPRSTLGSPAPWTQAPESHIGQLTQDMSRCVPIPGEAACDADVVELEASPPDGISERDARTQRWVWRYSRRRAGGPLVCDGLVRADWHLPAPAGIPAQITIKPDVAMWRGNIATVVDWKTTSARDAKSPWVLSSRRLWGEGGPPPGNKLLWNNVQFRIYTMAATLRGHQCTHATGQWVYGSKRLKGAHYPVWSVIETVGRVENQDWCDKYLWTTIAVMAQLRDAWRAGRLTSDFFPADGGACDFSGRFCDGIAYCGMKESPVTRAALHLPVVPQ